MCKRMWGGTEIILKNEERFHSHESNSDDVAPSINEMRAQLSSMLKSQGKQIKGEDDSVSQAAGGGEKNFSPQTQMG